MKNYRSFIGKAIIFVFLSASYQIFYSCSFWSETSEAAQTDESSTKTQNSNKKVFDNGRIKLKWKIDGNELNIRLETSYSGYIGLGFNTRPSMTGADLIIAKIDESGKVTVEDHFCKAGKSHKKDIDYGGTDRIKKYSSSRKDGWLTIDIVLPMTSEDANDISLRPGEKYYFLVAASNKKDMLSIHTFVTKFSVTL